MILKGLGTSEHENHSKACWEGFQIPQQNLTVSH